MTIRDFGSHAATYHFVESFLASHPPSSDNFLENVGLNFTELYDCIYFYSTASIPKQNFTFHRMIYLSETTSMASPRASRSPRLMDSIVPQRTAARRADSNFSVQLESSPIQSSDVETFGEPSRSEGKSKVKVQYGGRSNAKRNGVGIYKSGSKRLPTAIASNAPTRSVTATTAPYPRNSGAGVKRRHSELYPSLSDQDQGQGDSLSELSELTPLSSPTKSIASTRASMRTPAKKATAFKQSQMSPTLSIRARKTMLPPPIPNSPSDSKPKSKPIPKYISSLSGHLSNEIDGKWAARLGMFVWVLVDMKAKVVEDEYEDDNEDAPPRMWWPGLVSRNFI